MKKLTIINDIQDNIKLSGGGTQKMKSIISRSTYTHERVRLLGKKKGVNQ